MSSKTKSITPSLCSTRIKWIHFVEKLWFACLGLIHACEYIFKCWTGLWVLLDVNPVTGILSATDIRLTLSAPLWPYASHISITGITVNSDLLIVILGPTLEKQVFCNEYFRVWSGNTDGFFLWEMGCVIIVLIIFPPPGSNINYCA